MYPELLWNEPAEARIQIWGILQEKFKEKCQEILPLEAIADKCITQFRDTLFASEDKLWNTNPMLGTSDSWFEDFFLPLQDHLLTSFAYRFCCDNLCPKSNKECADAIFACTIEAKNDISVAGNSKDDRLRANRKKIKENIESLRKNSGAIAFFQDELCLPPNWLFFITMATNRSKDPFNISKKDDLIKCIQNQKYSFQDLTNLIVERDYIQLLLDWQDTFSPLAYLPYVPLTPPVSIGNSMHLCSANGKIFLALPKKDKNGLLLDPPQFPSQTYVLKNGYGEVDIDPRLQIVFNNYLLESAYHCYALSTIEHCVTSHSFVPHTMQKRTQELVNILSVPLLLRAPLLHPVLIKLVNNFPHNDQEKFIELLIAFIRRWNQQLPELEELFVGEIWHTYGADSNKIFCAIQDAMSGDKGERYRRLSFIRLVNGNVKMDTSNHSEGSTEAGKINDPPFMLPHEILVAAYIASVFSHLNEQDYEPIDLVQCLFGRN